MLKTVCNHTFLLILVKFLHSVFLKINISIIKGNFRTRFSTLFSAYKTPEIIRDISSILFFRNDTQLKKAYIMEVANFYFYYISVPTNKVKNRPRRISQVLQAENSGDNPVPKFP